VLEIVDKEMGELLEWTTVWVIAEIDETAFLEFLESPLESSALVQAYID
jgi:hypothetical protein